MCTCTCMREYTSCIGNGVSRVLPRMYEVSTVKSNIQVLTCMCNMHASMCNGNMPLNGHHHKQPPIS